MVLLARARLWAELLALASQPSLLLGGLEPGWSARAPERLNGFEDTVAPRGESGAQGRVHIERYQALHRRMAMESLPL